MDKTLNEKQLEAVNHKNGPLLIAAGAGSGKTKTLTSRLAKLIVDGVKPENIIAITFTNKAAQEMRSRILLSTNNELITNNRIRKFEKDSLFADVPFVGTFHSLGVRILKNEAKLLGRSPHFVIYDNEDSLSLIKQILKKLDISKDSRNPLKIASSIGTVKNELLDSEEYLDKISLSVFQKYEEELAKNNALDFDDLIEKPVKIFQKYPQILEKYQRQFQYILVDEYQDVNTSQYYFVKLLAEKHQNLNVVGDDAQSIYGFRGSDFRNFLNFSRDWPNAKIVKLEQNYRSTGAIIQAASAVIQNNKMQTPKSLWTKNDAGELIKIVKAPSADEEADFVAKSIKEPPAISHSQCAVLYRTNAQSRSIEQSLIERDIPYKIFGGLKFYERKEIKDIIAALRIAMNASDSVSKERLEKTFSKKITASLIPELSRLGGNLKILELINFFLEETDYFEHLNKKFDNARERIENINELIQFAGTFKELPEFLERVSLLQSTDAPANSLIHDSKSMIPVNLMSIHLAKGLEFDTVFLIGCNEGLLPHQMSYGTLDELEEERRLMYVAMTRARKNLFITMHATPSRFIYEIPPELTEFLDLGGGRKVLPDEDEVNIEDYHGWE